MSENETAPEPLRFGLVGVDSPHAPSFARLLGDGRSGAVRGARVSWAWRGAAAPDFPLARDRIDDLAADVSALGVPWCASPEEVAERCDAVLVVASDARTHPDYFRRVARFGKPVYVDTRFALTTADARAMLDAAHESGAIPLAGSPKRFTPELRHAVSRGLPAEGIDLVGPLPTQPGHPVLDWYGVHLVDLAVAAMGPGCVRVDAVDGRPVTLTWDDGRTATLTGKPQWSPTTRGSIRTPDGRGRDLAIHAGEPMLTGLLEALVTACRTGVPTVPLDEVLTVVAVVEAARESRRRGEPVRVDPLIRQVRP
jgi:predicted dehydrogenase